jgi:hypothetical protein
VHKMVTDARRDTRRLSRPLTAEVDRLQKAVTSRVGAGSGGRKKASTRRKGSGTRKTASTRRKTTSRSKATGRSTRSAKKS